MSTVSVIVPVHNGERFIEQSLRSIATQGSSVSEVIVLDDASSDGSMAIVDAFAHEAAVPVRVIRTEGVGQSAARNAGAQIASGDYLAFLDQDDVWLDGHVASLTECLDNNLASSMAYSDVNTIDADGGLLHMRLNARAGNAHPKSSVNEIIGADIMALPSATMVRRIAFLDLSGFDPALQGYEDDDLYFRGFRAGWNPRYVDEALVNYRTHASGSSMSPTFRASRLRFVDKIASSFPDNPRTHSHHIRDLLVPRMRRSFMLDYTIALKMGEFALARTIARDLRTLFELTTIRSGGTLTLKTRVGLWLLAKPRAARLVLFRNEWWFPRGVLPSELRFRP
jgi:glycosyltransferase involved in cell wall biosynthesis